VTDVIATQREEYTETALLSSFCYNSVEKKRSFYGVPYTVDVLCNHIWRPLVEKAGFKIGDIPKTWDAYYDFFKGVQKKLRAQGDRKVYGLGFQVTTNGVDPNNVFNYFLIAYGGQGIVTKDGKLHVDDPKVREAAIRALSYPATAYKEGFVPPSAINWNDADDNNAFHAKTIVMDLDGSLSTEVAIIKNQQDYNDIITMGLALDNDGKAIPSLANSLCGLIPKGAKNIDGAKDFLKFLIQPTVLNEYLKTHQWLVGDKFSVADLNASSVANFANIADVDISYAPNVKAWVERCLARTGGAGIRKPASGSPGFAQRRASDHAARPRPLRDTAGRGDAGGHGHGDHREREDFARARAAHALEDPREDPRPQEDHQHEEDRELPERDRERFESALTGRSGRIGERREQHEHEDHQEVFDDQPTDGDAAFG
jgi:hypothetical protein